MFPMIPADNIVETFLSLAFVLIAFISWIIRLVGQKKEDAEARARMERARRQERVRAQGQRQRTPESVRSEIDAFLKRSTQGGQPVPVDEVELEVVSEEELQQRRRPRSNKQRNQDRAATKREARERAREASARKSLAERAPLASQLPSSKSPASVSPEPAAWREIGFPEDANAITGIPAVGASPRAGVGSQTINQPSESFPSKEHMTGARVRDVAALLRNPRTVKEAIVINEVLRRPRGLRS